MEKITYQISSRAAILLGRESVSKVDGAIIELVKNTYDADATVCILSFDIAHNSIYIIDNGTGMTRDIIQNCWMLIGTDNKKIEYKSKKNRIKSGEKGIGRFALDRLGEICELYTKHEESKKTLYWKTDWRKFEESGKTINEVSAELDYLNTDIKAFIPKEIADGLKKVDNSIINNFESGTIIKISNLRDNWTSSSIAKIIDMLSYAIPSTEVQNYSLFVQKSISNDLILIENELIHDFDYKIKSDFDGENFHIQLFRNEFDLQKFPKDIFSLSDFAEYPYRKEDLEKGVLSFQYTIEQLNRVSEHHIIENIKNIGPFQFEYTFLKVSSTEDTNENYFYKTISSNRKKWMDQNAGIKIYRDNFIIRPYGDLNSDSFDWLSLDARKARSPAAPSHSNGSWKVRNKQGYGVVKISRVYNSSILDKSSREGIIDNEYFSAFKNVLANIIGILEKDRQSIIRRIKKYNDNKNETVVKRNDGIHLAQKIIVSKSSNTDDSKLELFPKVQQYSKESAQLAETILLLDKEKEELLTEIKLLRALATNGLITTSIIHDLAGLNAELKNRANDLKYVIETEDSKLVNDYLLDLKRNDSFLASWISVVITQLKQDKRKRHIADLYLIIKNLELTLTPLLKQKHISLCVNGEEGTTIKKIFSVDIESIVCNLIINSIEAFKKIELQNRNIVITLSSEDGYIKIIYKDNGPGISKVYKDPYDIFNFGVSDKKDNTGEIVGTGLGMYIVASTVNEYNGKYKINNDTTGFELEILFPNERN